MSRPCERQCAKCFEWKHYSRFRSWKHRRAQTSMDVCIEFRPMCKDCEQIERNERKNVDRASAIIDGRAARAARTAGVPKPFFWINMNWQGLVDEMRPKMTPEARCLVCGHPFLNERDIQIEHREPLRHPQDWARHHARNISISCASCNQTKRDKPYAQWLDEQEEARKSNEAHRTADHIGAGFRLLPHPQLKLW